MSSSIAAGEKFFSFEYFPPRTDEVRISCRHSQTNRQAAHERPSCRETAVLSETNSFRGIVAPDRRPQITPSYRTRTAGQRTSE
eukprot:scaffold341784_cov41-Prasinocladus_malaysianus.AAC.1